METTTDIWDGRYGYSLQTSGTEVDDTVVETTPVRAGSSGSSGMTYSCLLYDLMISGVLHVVLCVFGLVTNTLTCVVVWKDRKTSSTAFLLIVLAFVDDLVLLVWGIMRASTAIARYVGSASFFKVYSPLAVVGWGMASVVHTMATWQIVLVTVDRYVSVCLPHNKQKWLAPAKIRQTTGILLTACAVFALPRLLTSYIVYDAKTGSYRSVRRAWALTDWYKYGYNVALYYLVIYILPLCILCFCTYRLVKSLRETFKKRQEMTRSSRDSADITTSLVVVVVVYILCQFTNPIRRIWVEAVPKSQQGCGHGYYYYNVLSSLPVMISSATNFVVFVLCGKRFRRRLIELLLNRGKIWPLRSTTATNTRVGDDRGATTGNSQVEPGRTRPPSGVDPQNTDMCTLAFPVPSVHNGRKRGNYALTGDETSSSCDNTHSTTM